MQISGLAFQGLVQQPSSYDSNKKSSSFSAELASQAASTTSSESNPSDGTYSFEQLKTGFFGSSRSTLDKALASGQVVNTLSYLTPSDLDLVKKTTGITIKDGNYYNSNGSLVNPDADDARSAFDLANSLSEMRFTGGPEGDTGLQAGEKITVHDLDAFMKAYASERSSGGYMSDVAVIEKAEAVIREEGAS